MVNILDRRLAGGQGKCRVGSMKRLSRCEYVCLVYRFIVISDITYPFLQLFLPTYYEDLETKSEVTVGFRQEVMLKFLIIPDVVSQPVL